MMISETNKLCQVPVMNFLMNMSSIAVSDGRSPPATFAAIKCLVSFCENLLPVNYLCSMNSKIFCELYSEVDLPFRRLGACRAFSLPCNELIELYYMLLIDEMSFVVEVARKLRWLKAEMVNFVFFCC